MIEICLQGGEEMSKSINSTHVYDKEISLDKNEKQLASQGDKPIGQVLDDLKIESRLRSILLYALGMLNSAEDSSMLSFDFFSRMSKYLRSIGYYGDSPFMMANYGSSEYAQAFSRIGSLYRNVYIVNEELVFNSLSVKDN